MSIIVRRSDGVTTKIDIPVKNVHRTFVLFATTDKKPPITAVLVCLMDSDVLLLFPARFIVYLYPALSSASPADLHKAITNMPTLAPINMPIIKPIQNALIIYHPSSQNKSQTCDQ